MPVLEQLEIVDVGPNDTRLVDDVFPVLRELRQHLTADSLREVYEHGYGQGLRFIAAYTGPRCVGVAGWRLVWNTSARLKLYVDDLVTAPDARSTGVGSCLLSELHERARRAGCSILDLDSGVQRQDAHRFYFREGMTIRSFHFARPI